MTNEERDRIVLENLDIVQKNVSRTIKRVSLNIDAEELTNHLYLSLVVSAAKFDETRGVPVRRFLDSRLKSSCTDYLRITDHMSIFMRSKLKRLDKNSGNILNSFNINGNSITFLSSTNLKSERIFPGLTGVISSSSGSNNLYSFFANWPQKYLFS